MARAWQVEKHHKAYQGHGKIMASSTARPGQNTGKRIGKVRARALAWPEHGFKSTKQAMHGKRKWQHRGICSVPARHTAAKSAIRRRWLHAACGRSARRETCRHQGLAGQPLAESWLPLPPPAAHQPLLPPAAAGRRSTGSAGFSVSEAIRC